MGVMAERLEAQFDVATGVRDFGSWMASEQKRIFLICQRMLRDTEDADSATQDTFLKAWQALNKPGARELGEPDKWLTRIAVNTCLDRLRSRRWQFWRKRPKPEDEAGILERTAGKSPDAEDRVYAEEIDRRLGAAMEKLTDRQRSVFLLRHYEDHSLAEIGEILNLDIGTVKAHLFRALEKLRGELKDLYFPERVTR